MNHTNLSHLRFFLVFLFGFTIVSLFILTRTASYQRRVYSSSLTEVESTTSRDWAMYTVTVPKRHLSNLKSYARKVDLIHKLPPSSNVKGVTERVNALHVGATNSPKIKGGITDSRPKKSSVTFLRLPKGKLPPKWRSFIPVGAQLLGKKLRERRSDDPVFSKAAAKWPPEIEWPKPWIRPLNNSNSDAATEGKSVVCDMDKLSEILRPRLPPHLEIREFQTLPDRYKSIAEPRPQPACGNSGLVYPWKLLEQQRTEAKQGRKIWTLFVVKSAPAYQENRETVRETWGAQENFPSHRIFVLFVVGRTNDQNVTESLKIENEKYGDILQCDFLDHYHMLPIKVLSTFRWMLERDFDIDFFTMTDDDCLVHLPRLAGFFDKNVTVNEDYYKSVYCGFHHHTDALPSRRDNKWKVTREQYSEDLYPTFCHGGLWTLSRPLMHGLYCASEITKIGDFFLEDVLITGILREKLNFKETNIKRMGKKTKSDRSAMMFHAGYMKTAESAREKMMSEWDSWRKDWEKAISG